MSAREPKRLAGQVVVITGATAGVGRAVARSLGRRGAKLGLIARDPSALEEVRAELAGYGGVVLPLSCDVADADAVFAAAERVERALGPIDVWINNAMATAFSPVSEVSPEEFRRVTEVTYLGAVHGAMAALRHMRPRDRGTIVQVGSALAYRGIPLQAAYCGAKHALRGFTDALRTELLHEGSRIRLTAVHLPAVNTPQFDWARTKMGEHPRPAGRVYQPEAAAEAVVHAIRFAGREYWLGRSATLLILADMLAPQLIDRYLAATAVEGQSTGRSIEGERRDNLFEPATGLHRTRGSFGHEAVRDATRVLGPAAPLLAAAGGLALAAGSLSSARRGRVRDPGARALG